MAFPGRPVVVAALLTVAAAVPPARGEERNPPVAGGATSELLVFLRPGTDPAAFAREHGLALVRTLRSDPDANVYAAASPEAAKGARARARAHARVRSAWLNEPRHYRHMAFTPDDPYFHRYTPESPYPGQWHLVNEHVPGRDARVQGAWDRDVTGLGVTIGIVDDCLETTHPDLAPNYVAADSWDFGGNDAVPDPVNKSDEHGIAVAGVAAARGGNGLGVTGAAPRAGLAGLRIDFPKQTVAMFVDATLYHSSGASTAIAVKNHSYGYSTAYVETAAEREALAVSAAAGTVHCFAAGNERGTAAQDSNKQHLQSSPDAIAVAALGSDGLFAYYSSFGANVVVTTPSSSSAGLFRITTTDRAGDRFGYNSSSSDPFPDSDYTSEFGGTSSAAPLVSGVIALQTAES